MTSAEPTRPPTVNVVGLGPAGPELLSARATALIGAHAPPARWARTDRHPAADALGEHQSFDHIYEAASSTEEVYAAIASEVAALARTHGSVLYAVPGSPLVAERTVELLRAEARAGSDFAVVIEPALSFLDLAWARLGVDPLAAGARLVDGQRFETEAAGERGPLLIAQCDRVEVLSQIKLAVEEAPAEPVVVLQRLGLPDEAVFSLSWDDLDRVVVPDHLTSLWVPRLAAPVGAELVAFAELVRTLRAGCPWDRAQTHTSLRPFAIEEAYEVAEAIDRLDLESGEGIDELEEELGDLLFQVYFHATLAAESGWFNLADVARRVQEKLVRRHPHVFGELAGQGIETPAVVANWDQIKAAEKGRASVMDGVCAALPPRLYAAKVAGRAAKLGVTAALEAELGELDRAEAALLSAVERLEAAARAHERSGPTASSRRDLDGP